MTLLFSSFSRRVEQIIFMAALILVFVAIFQISALVVYAGQNQQPSASEEKKPKSVLKDGVYEGRTASNYRGTVIVTVREGKIAEIQAKPQGKDAKYKKEIDAILARIIETQEYHVDGYSGATRYTVAVVQAVENALRDAEEKAS